MTNTGNISSGYTGRTVKIDSDLSAKSKYFVKADTTDDDVVNLAEDGTVPCAVLVEGADGSTTTTVGTVLKDGDYYVVLAGTVENMDFLMPTTAGAAIKATDGNYYGAQALRQGVSGDIIPVRQAQGYLETT